MSDSKLDAAANAIDDMGSGLLRRGCFFLFGLPLWATPRGGPAWCRCDR